MTDDTDKPDSVVEFFDLESAGSAYSGEDIIRQTIEAAPEYLPFDLAMARKAKNDFGNGERLRERFGNHLRWVREWGWYAWDDRRWSFEEGHSRAREIADLTHQAMYRETRAVAERGPFRPTDSEEIETPAQFRDRIEKSFK